MTPKLPNDPTQIWQDQAKEKTMMSLVEIRQKARKKQNNRRLIGMLWLPFSVGVTIFFFLRQAYVPALVGVYFIHLAISMVKARVLSSEAGMMTSIQSYREYFQWELMMAVRVLVAFAVLMSLGVVAAVQLWMRAAVFPTRAALLFGLSYLLIGVLYGYGFRHQRIRNQKELRALDALEIEGG